MVGSAIFQYGKVLATATAISQKLSPVRDGGHGRRRDLAPHLYKLKLMCRAVFVLLLLCSLAGTAQQQAPRKIQVGIEQDLLPYATGGYFAGAWVGSNHVRVRALMARVHKPDIVVKKGFTHNNVTAYALLGDYFLQQGWKGWWAGTGLVYWKSSIQTDRKLGTAHFENWLLNGSIGYNLPLYRNFYVSPWAGMHLRVGGAKRVSVDDRSFTPPLLNPEGSVKVGVFF